jgi:Tectonin domain
VMSEVLDGLTFLATADPEAKVTFVFDWRDISVDAAPGNGDDYEDFEAPWRNAALQKMGFPGSRQGSILYVNSLRESLRTNWAYVAYFTKYPLHHFAYAGSERLVMAFSNDNWGSDRINQVFAHETCHIFGAADEYASSGCNCDGSGHHDVPNNNCENCNSAPVLCLMRANTLTLCEWTRGQLGWSTWQKIGGSLKHVSVAADGTVWGVNANDNIFRRDGDTWTRISGALKQVSVGAASSVWGVNADDKIFQFNGGGWTQVAGRLKHVSVAADGSVYGVNSQDEIYSRDGTSWTQLLGALGQISVGAATLVWGVNRDLAIFRRRV